MGKSQSTLRTKDKPTLLKPETMASKDEHLPEQNNVVATPHPPSAAACTTVIVTDAVATPLPPSAAACTTVTDAVATPLPLSAAACTIVTDGVRDLPTPILSSARLPGTIDPTVAVTAFQSQRDVLLTGIHSNLTVVANKLLAKYVITQEMLERATNARNGSRERGVYLLGCIQDRIKIAPADFAKVVDILQSELTLTQLASQLVDSYCNPSSANSALSVSPAISQFAEDLKAKYKCSPILPDKWPPTPSKEYIELAVVKGYHKCREAYLGHVLKGNLGEVPKRNKITEEQILDLCVQQVGKGRLIVIQGAPGIGKSTLAWELCRKWEEYASMKVYSLVILLRLREKKVQRISTVSDLFYAFDREDKKYLTEEIKNNQGRGVLFVLDGFDELPKSLQEEGILVDLLRNIVLPYSTVIVTSRPSARLHTACGNLVENRIEILGFTQDSVEAYAASVLPTDSQKDFRDYISASKNPAINSLMYVPLYAAFIVIIYKSTKSKSSLPRTRTQLYTQLCLTILNRHLMTKTEHPSVRRFEDLPDVLYKQFLELSELAYEGFTKEEVIFYGTPKEHFGFLDDVPDLFGGCEVSFNFLHLTLQEFFTAYHISQLTDSGVELFKTHGENRRWNVVWRFVTGLTQFKYLESSCPVRYSSFVHGDYITNFFIQCLFEAQSEKIDFHSIFLKKTMYCNCGYTHLDYYALGYCIANCTTPESSWEVNLGYHVDQIEITMFTQGLMTNNSSTGIIKLLHAGSPLHVNIIEYLHACINNTCTSPLSSITDLAICDVKLTSNKETIDLSQFISRLPHLQKLNIANCSFRNVLESDDSTCRGNDGLLKFLEYLPHSKVTSLNITGTWLEYHLEHSPLAQDYCTAIQVLTSHLQELHIGQTALDDSCHKGKGTIINLVSSLSSLSLEITDYGCLLNNFDPNNHLASLRINYHNHNHNHGVNWPALVPDIVRIIQCTTTLKALNLGYFDMITDLDINTLQDIIKALQGNNTLRCVTFVYSSVQNEEAERTLQALDCRVRFSVESIYEDVLSVFNCEF